MAKVMLFYPPGPAYQRGEDRSQGNIDDSAATSVRAANDLAYSSAMLKKRGHEVFLHDYQTEQQSLEALIEDFETFAPDVAFLSITNSTIHDDIRVVKQLKARRDSLVTMLKGALFFDPDDELLAQLDLAGVDYLIGGEVEFIIADLVDAHFNHPERLPDIGGILFKREGQWIKTDFTSWETDLVRLEYPDREALKNELYCRPDTGEPQATIATSRGCGAACIYCLTPRISGTRVRLRDPDSIVDELLDCYENHGIRNFFFKSDTFTMNRTWVKQVCDRIAASSLSGNIEWVANSRVNPLEPETLKYMRDAGCWLVAYGFESGSEETLKKIKKGATVHDNRRAARLTREAGLKCYGFYLVGLPWENWTHLKDTRRLIFDSDCDFIEVHIAVPYYGTELYEVAEKYGVLAETVLGKDYFNSPTKGSIHLSMDEIARFRRDVLLRYHLRPKYIWRRLKEGLGNAKVLRNYSRYGWRLVSRNLTRSPSQRNTMVASGSQAAPTDVAMQSELPIVEHISASK